MSYTIIDCHTHVYPDKIALKAADSIGKFYDISMRMDGSVSGLLKVMEEEGVSKSLICSAALTADRVPTINDFIAATVKSHPDKLMGLMTLEVRRSNAIAQALYHKVGFIDVGYRKRYYEDNKEDALIMYIQFEYEAQEEADESEESGTETQE